MSADRFSASDTLKLLGVVRAQLEGAPISNPFDGETEVSYSGRAIAESLRESIESLGITGLLLGGPRAAPVGTVSFLGTSFIPDFTLTYMGQRLIACEVKFLRPGAVQSAVATAIGQSAIYSAAGFQAACVFFVDWEGALTETDHEHADRQLSIGAGSVPLVLRRRGSDGYLESGARSS
jgi:hypothetical protein